MGKYSAEDQDGYLLENNLLGATSFEQLEQLESVAFSIRSSQLEAKGFDWLLPLSIDSLMKLHEFLFQDVYHFAGKLRDVQLMNGQTRFCQAEFIQSNLQNLCLQLQEEQIWKSKEEAATRLAYYKAEFNMVHPFQEGNGRTLRLVIRELARSKGYEWSFEKLDRSSYINAMIKSVVDDSLLKEILLKTLSEYND